MTVMEAARFIYGRWTPLALAAVVLLALGALFAVSTILIHI